MSDDTPTLGQLARAMRKHASRNPDRVYVKQGGQCLYEPDDDNPDGCIVGAAARDVDLDFDSESGSAFQVIRRAIRNEQVEAPSSRADVTAVVEAAVAQAAQDKGACWRDASDIGESAAVAVDSLVALGYLEDGPALDPDN